MRKKGGIAKGLDLFAKYSIFSLNHAFAFPDCRRTAFSLIENKGEGKQDRQGSYIRISIEAIRVVVLSKRSVVKSITLLLRF
jgi:hypothetical protein